MRRLDDWSGPTNVRRITPTSSCVNHSARFKNLIQKRTPTVFLQYGVIAYTERQQSTLLAPSSEDEDEMTTGERTNRQGERAPSLSVHKMPRPSYEVDSVSLSTDPKVTESF
ncbi:PREDICTED: uncharacterized protein LOC105454755 [Wasmannia auropunctata]|uniref:uncharacterized protein LOC105454755 n=1 Tax=Wasmannia auropunctata TaxID=64793 RepID=UPI0005EEF2D3|nr:PREDICTED: uncharacterized protein LOC105454755 [Wasmannia auropunctata]